MTDLPLPNPARRIGADTTGDAAGPDPQLITTVLSSYFEEARSAREGGLNPRDRVWEGNWNRYWGRYDHSDKAEWQSKHVMPEAPQFVDRWSAAMREALDANGQWFNAVDEGGQSNELTPHIEKVMRVVLSRCGITPDGHRTDFSSVFEDQMKLGAIMASCVSVTAKEDERGLLWPAVDSLDPRNVWRDPQGRNLYRLHRYMTDKHELLSLADQEDAEGEPLYDRAVVAGLTAWTNPEDRDNKERSSGGHRGNDNVTGRIPVQIDEWLCTLLMPDGTVAAHNALIVVANERHIIRGPEENPFWHDQDWVTLTPMISVPFSIYGRSYMEDWSSVADAFVEMTNLILDGAFVSAIRAFVADPSQLINPQQLAEGISPNTVFEAEEGADITKIIRELNLGTLGNDVVTVWQALKQEMREGAKLSEIALGQLPPNAHHTATAISEVTQSGSAMIRSMARTIESRLLEVVLTQVWQVTLQHLDFTAIAAEIGEETARMLEARREEFSEAHIRFRVRGISGLIDRQAKLRNLMGLLQMVAQSEALLGALFEKTTAGKLVDLLIRFMGIDPTELELSEQEKAVMAAVAAQTQATQGAQAAAQGEQGGAPVGGGAANGQ